jgi:hypothetical protein
MLLFPKKTPKKAERIIKTGCNFEMFSIQYFTNNISQVLYDNIHI